MVAEFHKNESFYTEGFRGFKKKATEVYEVMFFDMQKCIYPEILFNTLSVEIKPKC